MKGAAIFLVEDDALFGDAIHSPIRNTEIADLNLTQLMLTLCDASGALSRERR
jgi:hypothetical protein